MTTTLKNLYSKHNPTTSIIPYQDWVIVAYPNHNGIGVQIYETTDSLEAFENGERRLECIIQSEDDFEDQGYAVKWAFEQIGA